MNTSRLVIANLAFIFIMGTTTAMGHQDGSSPQEPIGAKRTLGTQGCCYVWEWYFKLNHTNHAVDLWKGSNSLNRGAIFQIFGNSIGGSYEPVPTGYWYTGTWGEGTSHAPLRDFYKAFINTLQCGSGEAEN